ncbi:MAG TPA: hypothetical protein VIZ65_12710 [Cellvibrionaceae bacterium]
MPHQYLTLYAEPEAHTALSLVKGCTPWRWTITLPALDEPPEFVHRLAKRSERVLIILVINQTCTPITSANQTLINAIEQDYPLIARQGHLALYSLGEPTLLVVDRANTPLPAKTGVGLARKIAADIALRLITEGRIKSSWIYCTDADAQLPSDYFSLCEQSSAVAASLPFTHIGRAGKLLAATKLYEQAIRYYAQGLRFAGSGYGFLSLGSALAFKATAYAKVRGFNVREAGEDFYLLNKLAKLGTIFSPEYADSKGEGNVLPGISRIEISARLSNRTPFGTGASVTQMCQLPRLEGFHYYTPECFFMLKHWFDLTDRLTQNSLMAEFANLPEPLKDALAAQNVHSLAEHLARQGKYPQQIQTICHTWLDGFRTLKIIRHLQSHCFPAKPFMHTLTQQPFLTHTDISA